MTRSAQIDIEELKPGIYEVVVDEFVSARSFEITLGEDFYAKYGSTRTKEELIRDSFRFLLAREPKEQILKTFNLSRILEYFPEYEQEFGH